MDKYPDFPGFRDGETSLAAAEAIAPKAASLRKQVLDYIRNNPRLTSDHIAIGMGMPPRRIQPRVSELRRMGLITNNGRRPNPNSGKPAHCWIAKG